MATSITAKRAIGLAALALVAGGAALLWLGRSPSMTADPANAVQVAQGRSVYTEHCATCHGAMLEGQPDWRVRKPDGRLPAPPHDDTGHTWHHPDDNLFGITKRGITPYAPAGYKSDMPSYADTLSDAEIWATLAYIKSRWSAKSRARQKARTR